MLDFEKPIGMVKGALQRRSRMGLMAVVFVIALNVTVRLNWFV